MFRMCQDPTSSNQMKQTNRKKFDVSALGRLEAYFGDNSRLPLVQLRFALHMHVVSPYQAHGLTPTERLEEAVLFEKWMELLELCYWLFSTTSEMEAKTSSKLWLLPREHVSNIMSGWTHRGGFASVATISAPQDINTLPTRLDT